MSGLTINSLISGYNANSGSKAFYELIRSISEAETKQEEDRIIKRETQDLQTKIGGPNVSGKHMKEFLVRLVYCEMLGHDVSWGYIHAVKLAQSSGLLEKRVGYLACCLFLHENHELMILLINTLQRDLKSTNLLVKSAALIAVCRLLNSEMIPAILPLVEESMQDKRPLVRKKAIMALHRFYTRNPESVSHLSDTFRHALCDHDPSVMAATLNLFIDIIDVNPSPQKNLVPSFVSILKQIIDRRLTRTFDYHGVPALWIQIKLLRILGLLGADDQNASESMYEVVSETLSRAETGHHSASAIVHECVRTITTIYPNADLIEQAARSIGRFLVSGNNNLRYLGITSLIAVIQVDPRYVYDHQMVIIDCLDDPDETIKRRTLDLLYRMTNSHNVVVITEKLVAYLRSTVDIYLRADLVSRITQLAERFAPNNAWFIQTMTQIFELGGDLVHVDVAHNLMRLLAEGVDSVDTVDSGDINLSTVDPHGSVIGRATSDLRRYAADTYVVLTDRGALPTILTMTLCWVLGEYGFTSATSSHEQVLDKLIDFADRPEVTARQWAVTAVIKVAAQLGVSSSEYVTDLLEKYASSRDVDLQQRCYEYLYLIREGPRLISTMLPSDASCEDLEVDSNLSFLDEYVANALHNGAQPYLGIEDRVNDDEETASTFSSMTNDKNKSGFNFEPYEKPETGVMARSSGVFAGIPNVVQSSATTPSASSWTDLSLSANAPASANNLSKTVKSVWGKSGYSGAVGAGPIQPAVDSHTLSDQCDTVATAAKVSTSTKLNSPAVAIRPDPTHVDLQKIKLASQIFGSVDSAVTTNPRSSKRESVSGDSPMLDFGHIESLKSDTTAPPHDSGSRSIDDSAVEDLLALDLYTTSMAPLSLSSATTLTPLRALSHVASVNVDGRSTSSVTDTYSSTLMTRVTSGISSTESSDASTIVDKGLDVPTTRSEFSHSAESSMIYLELSADLHLHISYAKVWKNDVFVALLSFTAKASRHCGSLSHVTTQLSTPSSLIISEDVTNSSNVDESEREMIVSPTSVFNSITLHDVTIAIGGSSVQHAITVSLRAHSTVAPNINGQVSYIDAFNSPRSLSFSVPLTFTDFLRPMAISTQQYGALWTSHTAERKKRLKLSLSSSLRAFLDTSVDILRVHPVEIIGHEGIAASCILGSTDKVMLLHSALIDDHLFEVTIRSNNITFTENIMRLVVSMFK